MYKDALMTIEAKFDKPQAAIRAQLDRLSNFPGL